MIEIVTSIQEYFLGHYTQWLFFIIIFIVGFIVISIIDRYIAHFFNKTDIDKTLEVVIQKNSKNISVDHFIYSSLK